MDSIVFLKNELRSIFERLSYLQIRYEYRGQLDTHIIHVLPTFCFEKDKIYAELQFDLEDKFSELYDENILFITDNDLIKIDNPILELGVSQDEIIVQMICAPIQAKFASALDRYSVETKFDQYYGVKPDVFKDTSTWNKIKKTLTTKKDLDKKHQGFFLFNFVIWQNKKKHYSV